MAETNQAVHQKLFADDTLSVYSVLDGASVPNLRQKMFEDDPARECLYRGELQPDMAEVAPYLIHLQINTPFTDWVLQTGWGKHWGIFALSSSDLRSLRRHFRTLLTVHDPSGKPLLFRYYDPRVLRVYLPICNAEELATIFGPIDSYLLEDEDPLVMLRYRLASGSLKQERFPLQQ
jgi:hypothetical protein